MTKPDHLPNVRSRYGAPMGRGFRSDAAATFHMEGRLTPRPESEMAAARAAWRGRVYLVRVRLDSGGYDRGGAYWGHGAPLYSALSDDGAVDMIVRTATRDAAKAHVLTLYPNATFFR